MNTRYEFNMDVPPREAIRLMYVSKSRFGGDWNSVPHTHSCTEVFYCVDGRGQFNVEGKMLDVAPDDMVIVNPRTLHTELSYQANPLEYIVLGIEGIEILFDQKDHGYTMLKCSPQREELLSLMQLLLREIDAREDGCEMVCQDLTEVLLVKIVRMASVSLRLTAPPAESKEFRMNILVPDFKAYGQKIIDELNVYAASQPGWSVAPDNFEGVRVNLDKAHGDGWFLLRLSLHDPLIPLNIESDSVGGVRQIAAELAPFLRPFDQLDTSALLAFAGC